MHCSEAMFPIAVFSSSQPAVPAASWHDNGRFSVKTFVGTLFVIAFCFSDVIRVAQNKAIVNRCSHAAILMLDAIRTL